MMQEQPYFMTNKEWYYYDYEDGERGIKLTDKAPEKAKESYDEFYAALDAVSEGEIIL